VGSFVLGLSDGVVVVVVRVAKGGVGRERECTGENDGFRANGGAGGSGLRLHERTRYDDGVGHKNIIIYSPTAPVGSRYAREAQAHQQ
jgi:hypothetical protein